jgi:hypothetical protein
MGMTVIKGAMIAGITAKVMVIMGGEGGIVGMTDSMTAAMMVGTMGAVDDSLPAALRLKAFSARPKPLAQQSSWQQCERACHHTSRCIEPLHGFSMSFDMAFGQKAK